MKKRVDFKLEFKKERITKLNSLQIIKGGDPTDHTDDRTYEVNCEG